jgi:hypothetical protein
VLLRELVVAALLPVHGVQSPAASIQENLGSLVDDGVPESLERDVDICRVPNKEFPQLLGQDPQEVRFQL